MATRRRRSPPGTRRSQREVIGATLFAHRALLMADRRYRCICGWTSPRALPGATTRSRDVYAEECIREHVADEIDYALTENLALTEV